MTDIEISNNTKLEDIRDIASKIGLKEKDIELYGKYKAKINYKNIIENKKGKVILMTAMSPTEKGIGKTTTTIYLNDGLNLIGKKSVAVLREPALGPTFGMKGGATGGGYSQVVPMEDINLHFTGDFHAITAANNLIVSILENSIYYGNPLNIDTNNIIIKRCIDLNDRGLRNITINIPKKTGDINIKTGFDITSASEMMSIFCLAKDEKDLRNKIDNIIVAYDINGNEILAKKLNCTGAVMALLKEAIKPNLVQTIRKNPVVIHGGPFANISIGCNSIISTSLSKKIAEYVVTEAGFGADLGAEKFLNIKSQMEDINPKLAILVATIPSLKLHAGIEKNDLEKENPESIKLGFLNLKRHIENLNKKFNLKVLVAINRFPSDKDKELETLKELLKENNVEYSVITPVLNDEYNMKNFAEKVIKILDDENENISYTPIYKKDESIKEKINKIVKNIYGAKEVEYEQIVIEKLKELENTKYDKYYVCIAKTPYSFSDKKELINAPENFNFKINDIKVMGGAGYIVVYTENVITLPGYSKQPSAEKIDLDEKENKIIGLF